MTPAYSCYRTLDELLSLIPEISEKLRHFVELDIVKSSKGATYNHQAWEGGYLDHVTETMNIACWLYDTSPRSLPFSLSDALLVMFLHDLEKPFKGVVRWIDKQDRRKFRGNLIKQNGIVLTPEQNNALEYVEGEHDYSNTERKMGELAAFCHCCDILSARIWFNHGKENSW